MRTEIEKKMKETADFIFRHPELSLHEKESSAGLAEFLEEAGDDDDNYDGGEDEPQSGNHSAG